MICTDLNTLKALCEEWRNGGERIVFTNGVFDILHLGHVTYLNEARSLGDRLVVGINNDASVKRLGKGPERPINPEHARAAVVDALRCVDAVCVFGDDTPYDLIVSCMPDVLVKGGDYNPEERNPNEKSYIVGSDLVLKSGGRVVAIPLVQGYSTTSIAGRMKS